MWVLEQPGVLVFLPLLIPLIWVRHFWPGRGGRVRMPIAISDGSVFSPPPTARALLYRLTTVVYWLAVAILIVAAAGPARTTRESVFLTRGLDIMLVLDQSASMAARDFPPENRFESLRAAVRRFIDQRENDHIGLIGFSAEAALRVPPTLDYDAVRESLNAMQLLEMGDGTAIGMGIALATLHLQGSQAEERIIIVLTDGVNNAGELSPEAAAAVAGETGIRVYAVGVGSGREAAIEVRDPATGELYRGTVRDGYDEALLREIAARSGGTYFAVGSPGALESVFDTISTVETTERRVQFRVVRDSLTRDLLILAAVLLAAQAVVRRLIVGYGP